MLFNLFKDSPPSEIPYFISRLERWKAQKHLPENSSPEARAKWEKELPKIKAAITHQLFKEIPSLQSLDACRGMAEFTLHIEKINDIWWGFYLFPGFRETNNFKSFLLEAQLKEEDILKIIKVYTALFRAGERTRLERNS